MMRFWQNNYQNPGGGGGGYRQGDFGQRREKNIKLFPPPPLENIVSRPWVYDPYFVQTDGHQVLKLQLEVRRNFSRSRESFGFLL